MLKTKSQEQIRSFILNHRQEMFTLLEKLVITQSGSYHKIGVDRVVGLIRTAFEGSSFSCEEIQQADYGNHLIFRSPACSASSGQILLTGHMDTVFPPDTAFNGYREDGECCYGPGVIDMKGGLAAGIFALKSLESIGLIREIPVAFVFNSDEEIGSPASGELIRQEARKSRFAFVLEAGGLKGEVVTGRKGNCSLRLDVHGEAGHAAFAGKDKASAILEMARKTVALEALNDPDRGISVNVGKIEGGIGPNTVPAYAWARIDCRFINSGDGDRLKKEIEQIINAVTTPRTRSQLSIVSGRPAMPPSRANSQLFQWIKEVADDLTLPVIEEFRQGVSDANLIADENIPVLDGLGPIGAKDHSEDEYMVKESLIDRSVLLACSIPVCWNRRGMLHKISG
jgi:glutamate carboxypeptidase